MPAKKALIRYTFLAYGGSAAEGNLQGDNRSLVFSISTVGIVSSDWNPSLGSF